MTVTEIERDGLAVDERLSLDLDDDTPLGRARAFAQVTAAAAEVFARRVPDVVVVLGDRYEILGVASAAVMMGVPVAHISGGEITQGAIDDYFRHALTKMSRVHFAAVGEYAERIVRMGEDPRFVHTVGAMGVDAAAKTPALSKEEVSALAGFPVDGRTLVVTYHPVTAERNGGDDGLDALCGVLASRRDLRVIFTGTNADAGGGRFNEKIRAFVGSHQERMVFVPSLGQTLYFSALRYAGAVVGNSSSGIVEAPAFGIVTVNIGDRQKGRVRAESVIDCEPTAAAISAALEKALSPAFAAVARSVVNPYGDGLACERVAKVLLETDFAALGPKGFYDGQTTAGRYGIVA
jgi:UDP-hydrolysing UDP-N-acetyl-D-glucosamine 2-epimerase